MTSTRFGLNASYVESLRAQWIQDPSSVAEEWRRYFVEQGPNGQEVAASAPAQAPKATVAAEAPKAAPAPKPAKDVPQVVPGASDDVQTLRGVSAIIAENMEASLGMPTAMSSRNIPVKVLEENRRVINAYLKDDARPKASFTHIIAWALVQAAREVGAMNNGYTVVDGSPVKLVREDINFGLAVDLPARGGGRSLVVPNIKRTQTMNFFEFFRAYNDVIDKAGRISSRCPILKAPRFR